jgi:hypothetical protein
MSGSAPSDVASSEQAPARDFDGLYKALLEARPREASHLLCSARLEDLAVILDGPTEQAARTRSPARPGVLGSAR